MAASRDVVKVKTVAVLGNPNAGKSTVFNALTGLRQSTANYPGVTVEKKSGKLTAGTTKIPVAIFDLPGTYSLLPRSPDEDAVHDTLLGVSDKAETPDLAVIVLDATNLERNLYLALQILELGMPTILVLNMWDLVEQQGIVIDTKQLEHILGVPCVRTIGNRGIGMPHLRQRIAEVLEGRIAARPIPLPLALPPLVEEQIESLKRIFQSVVSLPPGAARGEALRLLTDAEGRSRWLGANGANAGAKELRAGVFRAREVLERGGIVWGAVEAEHRYAAIERLCGKVVSRTRVLKPGPSERLDRVLTHQVWGLVCFAGLMSVLFQAVFGWAQLPMDAITWAVDALGSQTAAILPQGQLQSLIVDGIIAGVGNVVIFLPQILLLFFFIGLFEDSGYMARAAFVLDRLMKRVGLNGKAFLPLLSSFACAVPGVMATRTIPDRRERLATILVAPLMSCSARLPVYTLMIAAFIPATPILGVFGLQGLTLLSMYLLSVVVGLGMAALFRKTLLKGDKTPFVFELPPYRVPKFRVVARTTWQRGKEFLARAGTIIFCVSILLWFLASYPRNLSLEARYVQQRSQAEAALSGEALTEQINRLDSAEAGEALAGSFAGRLGHWIEPVIRPLGFDWRIGVGLVGSFAAREVLVSTMAIIYNVGQNADENSVQLIEAMRAEVSPETGKPVYTGLVAVSLMVYFVLACQCMSTLAIVRRETNSWGWTIFMFAYMTALAWIGSFAVYQGGRLLGMG